MNYLSLENVTKTYGDKILFRDVNLQIGRGQKVALVAKNGTGKTTLLRVIAGLEGGEGENHRVFLHRDIRVGYLEQEPTFEPHWTVIETVFASDNPLIRAIQRYEWALLHPDQPEELQASLVEMDDLKAWDFEARIKEILFKLNITDLEQTVGTLSGGQVKRLALAKLLIDEPEFLILDEPTNHLDLDMVEWLEEYLDRPNLTLFIVTHDRYFLERVCDTIVELDRGTLYKYSGSYSDFLEKKFTRQENQAVEVEKARKLMTKELEWIRRMPKARGTKAKARVDAFEEIKDKASRKVQQQEIQIDIKGARLGSKILELHDISKRFDELRIVDGFTYKFKKKERVGIVGKNGVGKTTFLQLLTKEIRPDTGKVVVGETVQFGYYTQEGINLKEDKRVIDVITDIAEFIPLEKGQKLTATQLLDRFLFSKQQQQVYVSQLSGGERRRLHLLTVLMQNPNFLILDEPTNDLDILALNVLEDFLMDFPGCVVIVTHDRYFMDKIVDHLFIFEGDGRIRDFNGKYLEYREIQKEEEREERRQERAASDKPAKSKPVLPEATGLTLEERKELKRLEKEIDKLETRKKEINERFHSNQLSLSEIEELSAELGQLHEQLEAREMRWMELADKA
ncbi:MAG: ABC-F family ATP-binding cassette domain-containing protein [Saprospiraceae bacterium]|nr:ABC-F family ATP-binding cassette domain-containing protein [Saprospiraceae bacterium]MCB0624867.1 ABC-F family ATP-binding cassette domain-containing protein [Saprospiraceae bacterium]